MLSRIRTEENQPFEHLTIQEASAANMGGNREQTPALPQRTSTKVRREKEPSVCVIEQMGRGSKNSLSPIKALDILLFEEEDASRAN